MPKAFQCPNCQAATWGDLKFCPKCGTNLNVTCPNCDFSIRYIQASQYQFCPQCGAEMNVKRKKEIKND